MPLKLTGLRQWILTWLVMVLVLGLGAATYVSISIKHQLKKDVIPLLEARLSEAFTPYPGTADYTVVIQGKLAKDLSTLPLTQVVSTFASCHGLPSKNIKSDSSIALSWYMGRSLQQTSIDIQCQQDWSALAFIAIGIATLATVAFTLLPPTMTFRQRQWMQLSQQAGIPYSHARSICADKDNLCFDVESGTAVVHGIPIELPKTPLLYLVWYATLRVENTNEGWFLNPQTNRPDHDTSAELLALMKRHGGHNKAINELENNGLKAKTLDQNRNKIKDVLVQSLGDALAEPYLFDMQRDSASGRFRYRLRLSPEQIHLP
ncbi:hypothetical protein HBA55_22355 [Pseudomaricurvus alkylphenolicus]|uniref:hypothetical protein n=1 Tax=Pseudomaricurvus alkylphenolicus TaxID=1306991 RepID=UPI001420DAD3|nr:hypothetical protein [Pseudomaricurvus alkylphenolicus]NIB42366.1 hypothetical protein [Pseudomaricurvus alkylphenolicus]